jgi:hypothetical protein
MERRRQEYARYSPVFWQPAKNVLDLHAEFLRRQISSETNIALRTDHGFIICERRPQEGFVDDFAVEHPGSWHDEGAMLLLAAAERLSAGMSTPVLRVVTAHADRPKVNMLASQSFRLAEQWWVLELQPARGTASGDRAAVPDRVGGLGFSGILGPAPPVYDPGGPVFLAERVEVGADISIIEREAAALGAVLAIVPAAPETDRARELRRRRWSVASDWYVGPAGSA